MPNRLAAETSPYLLQHRDNPVDWYPWGEEALERARREERPIFLSIGYSTCYWCHVMERESFEDAATAELMNEAFVNIKVDREERPDLDEIYMVATQVFAGQGGWPNSLFLTPELEPYFAGTYFPPRDAHGRPGFPTVLRSMRDAWAERRDDVVAQAQSVAGAIRHYLEEGPDPGEAEPDGGAAAAALADLQRRYDPVWGGFGGAPKFPTPSNLRLLEAFAAERSEAKTMLGDTLDQMARGGIFDQIGGGFHRYATDREWKVPHFEKMLYDNAWLLESYARWHASTGDAQAARVVRGIVDFLERELTSPEGALWSALDAETDGHEGAFYVWTRDEIETVLGAEDAAYLAPLFGFDRPPFFEGTHYVLHLPARLEEQAERRRVPAEDLLDEIAPLAARLFDARARRPPLRVDDKVLTDWNGMAIAGLATAGRLLEEPEWVARAGRAADFLLETVRDGSGVLLHSWREGTAKVEALLGDYVFLVRGLLALDAAGGEDGRWLEAAVALTEQQIERLHDGEGGGFFVAAPSPDLLVRSKEATDGAVPSGNGVAAENLLVLAERTGEARYEELATEVVRTFGALLASRPSAAVTLALAARRLAGDGAAAEQRPVAASLWADLEEGRGSFRLELAIADGWHLPVIGEAPPSTRVELDGGNLLSLSAPDGEPWSGGPGQPAVEVYRGTVVLEGEVDKVVDGARLRLHHQPCDDRRCLAPDVLELPL